jgi:3'-phosphoadenosine 5'-phosphosulfate sulfotransferase (PAPS reductase)/FAD synthetase
MKKHMVMFSGGKDSTAMLLRLVAEDRPVDGVIMADLGMEFPEMYEHVAKVEEYIGIPITRIHLDKPFAAYLLVHFKGKGKRVTEERMIRDIYVNTEIGYSFPDMGNRWCTGLKKQIIKQYMRKQYAEHDIIEYHGIASNEAARTHKNKDGRQIIRPLLEWGMTEKDTLQYCYDCGFDWGGLYHKLRRVSCWCCPLKSLDELEILYREYPEKWATLKAWEASTYRTFRPGATLEQLEQRFMQGKLFAA